MDRQGTRVEMSLKDFEEMQGYEKAYNRLIKTIKNLTQIDKLTCKEVEVSINTLLAQDLIVPFAAEDMELEGYPHGVKVVWK